MVAWKRIVLRAVRPLIAPSALAAQMALLVPCVLYDTFMFVANNVSVIELRFSGLH